MSDYTRLSDAISSKEGRAFITRDGVNRKMFELAKIDAKVELKTSSKQMLGHRVEQTKVVGMKISGTLTGYLMTSDYIEYAKRYKETGYLEPITIQTVMEDSTSTVGRSEILLKDVVLTSVPLVTIDDSSDDAVTFDSDFTAADFEVISKFAPPSNYR